MFMHTNYFYIFLCILCDFTAILRVTSLIHYSNRGIYAPLIKHPKTLRLLRNAWRVHHAYQYRETESYLGQIS